MLGSEECRCDAFASAAGKHKTGRYHIWKATFSDVEAILQDFEIEEEEICIRMLSPICVYATDVESGRTTYFHPAEEEFARRINENFQRKYIGYTGVEPDSKIQMELLQLHEKG